MTEPVPTAEAARALLWRHGLPEDVIDGALALFAQELAGKIRAWHDRLPGEHECCDWNAADLISPENWARHVPDPAVLPSVPGPPTTHAADRAELRDRIRRAVCEAEGFAWDSDMLEPDEYGDHADMVLAVLPPPADRAAIYREVAEELAGIDFHPNAKSQNVALCGLLAGRFRRKADEVERLAIKVPAPNRAGDETRQGETVHGCPPDGSGITPCCGRTPFELPRTDRMSTDPALVTCQPAVSQPDGEV